MDYFAMTSRISFGVSHRLSHPYKKIRSLYSEIVVEAPRPSWSSAGKNREEKNAQQNDQAGRCRPSSHPGLCPGGPCGLSRAGGHGGGALLGRRQHRHHRQDRLRPHISEARRAGKKVVIEWMSRGGPWE